MFRLFKLFTLLLFVVGCSRKPQTINYGRDDCDFCRMTIMNPKFGGELITQKGKVYKFDSEECLLNFYKNRLQDMEQFAVVLVANYAKPGEMLATKQAVFLENDSINTPMGGHIIALPDKETARKYNISGKGKLLDWNSLLDSFR